MSGYLVKKTDIRNGYPVLTFLLIHLTFPYSRCRVQVHEAINHLYDVISLSRSRVVGPDPGKLAGFGSGFKKIYRSRLLEQVPDPVLKPDTAHRVRIQNNSEPDPNLSIISSNFFFLINIFKRYWKCQPDLQASNCINPIPGFSSKMSFFCFFPPQKI